MAHPQTTAANINRGRVREKRRITIARMEVTRQGRITLSLLWRSRILAPRARPETIVTAKAVKKRPGLATPQLNA